jgi:hypothetical protein
MKLFFGGGNFFVISSIQIAHRVCGSVVDEGEVSMFDPTTTSCSKPSWPVSLLIDSDFGNGVFLQAR